jgi:prepilin-type N-terminal cleavage/methylation domain-containing protein
MKTQFHSPAPNLNKQKGMTLIELIIVVVVLGFLAIVAAKAFSNAGVTDGSKAQALFEASGKLSQNTVLLAQAAGTSPVVTGSTLPSTGNTLLDVLVTGVSAFNTTSYPNAYATSGVTAMPTLVQGSSGSYRVAGYALTMGGGNNAPHTFQFASVPDGVTQILVAKYGSNATSLATAGDSTNPVIQYGTATAGLRTVTILRPL